MKRKCFMSKNIIDFALYLVQIISILIASISCYMSIKSLKFNRVKSKVDRIINIYSEFFASLPIDKLDQGYMLWPETAFSLVSELSTYDKTLMQCHNELKLLIFNETSIEALNLRKSIENARNLYRIFYEKLSLYVNSQDYRNDLAFAGKISKEKFHTEITPQSIAFNSSLRKFYAQQLEEAAGIKAVSQALENLKVALKDENFDIYFYDYLKKISS